MRLGNFPRSLCQLSRSNVVGRSRDKAARQVHSLCDGCAFHHRALDVLILRPTWHHQFHEFQLPIVFSFLFFSCFGLEPLVLEASSGSSDDKSFYFGFVPEGSFLFGRQHFHLDFLCTTSFGLVGHGGSQLLQFRLSTFSIDTDHRHLRLARPRSTCTRMASCFASEAVFCGHVVGKGALLHVGQQHRRLEHVLWLGFPRFGGRGDGQELRGRARVVHVRRLCHEFHVRKRRHGRQISRRRRHRVHLSSRNTFGSAKRSRGREKAAAMRCACRHRRREADDGGDGERNPSDWRSLIGGIGRP
mmetsp:Transcript_10223/g.62391  ORF Transcript_10223/g.62391 Transcript_10223/m.62391 type:complete len:302 (+) Transcript_10223:4945-5850(+)